MLGGFDELIINNYSSKLPDKPVDTPGRTIQLLLYLKKLVGRKNAC